jgi:RHH-type proline utilization regulon transcriptional repressor/proline dehydrogenase/delta 1-pyrroline-5-carboxylate dehydrogenase
VRRLLENGANTSFVNQIADPAYPIDKLLADPVARARSLDPVGAPHPRIALPRDLFAPERANSTGFDISNEQHLVALAAALTPQAWHATPMLGDGAREGTAREVRNPAELSDSRRQRRGRHARAGRCCLCPGDRVDSDAQARADCLLRVADRWSNACSRWSG